MAAYMSLAADRARTTWPRVSSVASAICDSAIRGLRSTDNSTSHVHSRVNSRSSR